jgi:hypothetical protein
MYSVTPFEGRLRQIGYNQWFDDSRLIYTIAIGSVYRCERQLSGDILAFTSSIDTISGGSGNDVFVYAGAGEDGNNAADGGPVELITDVNWADDRFDTPTQVTFAANVGASTGANLNASANNAIAAAFALAGGGGAVHVRRAHLLGDRPGEPRELRRRRRPPAGHHGRHGHDRGEQLHLNSS